MPVSAVMSTVQFVNSIRLSKKITDVSGGAVKAWRKYRPLVNQYRGHYNKWWNFAMQCVLSEIQRKRDNWSWKSFKAHTRRCRDYTDALVRIKLADTYSNVLKKWTHHLLCMTDSDEECIKTSEKQLNILSLMLCRKKAQIKIERHEEFAKTHHSKGWMGTLYDWKIVEEHSDEITQSLSAPWTREEKEKLILAADFCESEEPPPDPGSKLIYPLAFVGFRAAINAKEMNVTVKDYETNADGDQILQIKFSNVQTTIETRPAGNGSKIQVKMKSLEVTVQSTQAAAIDDQDPNYLLKAVSTKPGQHLDICYEKFPLDSPSADEKLSLAFSANAIELVNHAATVKKIMSLISQATRPYSFYSSKMPWLRDIV